MSIKKIISFNQSGKSVYCITKRESDGFFLDSVDGVFRASPSGFYTSMVEDSIMRGRYEVDESRTVWTDGVYTATCYKQSGSGPSPVDDDIFGINYFYVKGDSEILPAEELAAINWKKMSSPVLVEHNFVGSVPEAKFNMVMDRTIDLLFDLHVDITGDLVYFAMKNDKSNDYYDVGPIECVHTNSSLGLLSLTIPNTDTINLVSSRYYGELFRLTDTDKYQTLSFFSIDLFPAIISSNDV